MSLASLNPRAFLIFNRLDTRPGLIGMARPPGDVRFTIFGREIFLSRASGIVLAVPAAGISHML